MLRKYLHLCPTTYQCMYGKAWPVADVLDWPVGHPSSCETMAVQTPNRAKGDPDPPESAFYR
eukprot:SAG22_NODE_15874_length_338_cov_0.761506_1_plen_61_part_10